MVVQDLVQGAEEEPRLLKEPVTMSVQELVQGVIRCKRIYNF
jgi:hypothetical protein